MQAATNDKWWSEILEQAAIYAVCLYSVVGLYVLYMLIAEPSTPQEKLWMGLFAAPAGLYFGHMLIIRPLLVGLAVALALFLRCLPLIITGFLLGVGYWIAMHLL
jgi:hypothetical protein